jgi:hypothetical protein
MKRAGGWQFGGEFRGLLERPARTKKGAGEKLANPLKSVVELRGIACEQSSHAQRSFAAPRTPDPQTARTRKGD